MEAFAFEQASSRIDQRKPDIVPEKNVLLAMMEKKLMQ
jgi:hypothetical protein